MADHGRDAWRGGTVSSFAHSPSSPIRSHLTTHVPRLLVSQFLLVVKKTTGGRAWLPKWGFSGLTKGQKVNKKQQREEEQAVVKVLREAEQSEIQYTTKHQTAR